MNLPGKITITKNSKDFVSIRVKSAKNGEQFLKIEMSVADFAHAVFGLAEVDMSFDIRGAENVDKEIEHNKIKIDLPDAFFETYDINKRIKIAEEAVERHLVDGWQISRASNLAKSSNVDEEQKTLIVKVHRVLQ